MPTRPDFLAHALQALELGFSLVPPRGKGKKNPSGEVVTVESLQALGLSLEQATKVYEAATPGKWRADRFAWKQWSLVQPSVAKVESWYADRRRTGFGLVCGAISGNLEVLDFDDEQAYENFHAFATGTDGLRELVLRIEAGYTSRTPSGGYHLAYRCSVIEGNQKLAERPLGKNKRKALIETRGEGGYVVEPPTHGDVHPTGKPYVQLLGGLSTLVTITPDERALLLGLARSFNEVEERVKMPRSERQRAPAGSLPGQLFAAATSWAEILQAHGWTVDREAAPVTYWTRPGKRANEGISATTGFRNDEDGQPMLYVFSTSTSFDPQRFYGKFFAYAILNHNGDFKAASQALRERGFRPPEAPRPTPQAPTPHVHTHSGAAPAGLPTRGEEEAEAAAELEGERKKALRQLRYGRAGHVREQAEAWGPRSWGAKTGDLDIEALQRREDMSRSPVFAAGAAPLVIPPPYIFHHHGGQPLKEELIRLFRMVEGNGSRRAEHLERDGWWMGRRCTVDPTGHGDQKAHFAYCHDPMCPTCVSRNALRFAVFTPRDLDGSELYHVYHFMFFVAFERGQPGLKHMAKVWERTIAKINMRKQYRKRVGWRKLGWHIRSEGYWGEASFMLREDSPGAGEKAVALILKALGGDTVAHLWRDAIFSRGNQLIIQMMEDASGLLYSIDAETDNLEERFSDLWGAITGGHNFETMGDLRGELSAFLKANQDEKPDTKCERCGAKTSPFARPTEHPPAPDAYEPPALASPVASQRQTVLL